MVKFSGLRVILLLGAGLALLAGLDAAALRIGAWAPVASTTLATRHGALMICGFLGTAISLERAVAARRTWAFAAPAAAILGTVLALRSPAQILPGLAWSAAFALLCGLYLYFYRRRPDTSLLIQGLGALSALAGSALWARELPWPTVAPFLLFFPIFTILGERLELANVTFAAARLASPLLALSLAATSLLFATPFFPNLATTLLGACLATMGGLMLWGDVARRTIRAQKLTRFSAAAILTGYVWLEGAALLWAGWGPATSGYRYEALIHAVTIGFTMSMIFAHAPIIVPAVIHRALPYHPVYWVALVLLNGGLLVRFGVGATRDLPRAWQWGAALNITATLLFMAIVLTSLVILPRLRRRIAQKPAQKPAPSSQTPLLPLPPARAATPEPATPEPATPEPATPEPATQESPNPQGK